MRDEDFSRYAEKYRDTVYRVSLNYLKNTADAEDVVQDTFIKLYTSLRRFTDDEHVRRWLVRVCVNRCNNLLRSKKRHPEVDIDELALSIPFEDERQAEVFSAMMALPPKYRVAIYLYYYEEYSTKEIAQILKLTVSTVTTRLSRGRAILREQLGEVTVND